VRLVTEWLYSTSQLIASTARQHGFRDILPIWTGRRSKKHCMIIFGSNLRSDGPCDRRPVLVKAVTKNVDRFDSRQNGPSWWPFVCIASFTLGFELANFYRLSFYKVRSIKWPRRNNRCPYACAVCRPCCAPSVGLANSWKRLNRSPPFV